VSGTTATLAGNTPTVGTGSWSRISGAGTVTTPSSPTSGVTGLGIGSNVFRWTISNGTCASSTDDVTIKVKDPTTSTLTSSPDSSAVGQSVTFSDSVSGTVPDGGKVLFVVDGSPLGDSVAINGSGVASKSTLTLTAGSHSVQAFYGGTANFDTSRSNVVTQTVHQLTITATAGANGTIAPSGTVDVNYGANQGFIINGDPGFRVANVLVDGDSIGSVTSHTFTNVTADHTISATFESTVAYAVAYRSFRADSLALSKDNKGKAKKYVKRKPDKVDFQFVVRNDSTGRTGIHVEFSTAIDTSWPFFTTPASTKADQDGKLKKWNFTFGSPLSPGDSVKVTGFGNKGKPQKVGKYWWTKLSVKNGPNYKNPFFVRNQPKLPMPNRINALAEDFAFSGFASTTGFLVGKDRTLDSAKQYGWLLAPKYTNVLNTLLDKTGQQTGAARGFDVFLTGKPILKKQTTLPPTKFNDVLLADMIALRVNIVSSQLQRTPLGFGELIYNDGGTNPLNGLMIKEIAHFGDSLMMGKYVGATHVFATAPEFLNLDTVVQALNKAFEGPLDTVKFADTLKFKGTRPLADVPYLRSNSSAVPERLVPLQVFNVDLPLRYELRQNYPNPFNPTTTIEFQLTDPAVVTLKVYNIVGQEIATLIDNQMMEDGEQQVQFDASNFASGVYFYRIVAEQPANVDDGIPSNYFTKTLKMLLIK
jgi:hypothetical protein